MPIVRTWDIAPDRPVWRCAALCPGPIALLDSALASPRLGRHSFLVADPPAMLTARRRRGITPAGEPSPFLLTLTTWREPGGAVPTPPAVRTWSGDPFSALRQLQAAYAVEAAAGTEPAAPFSGGLVGWLGYGAAHALEHLPDQARDDLGLPDLCFLVADQVLATDHATGRTTLSLTGRGTDPDADAQAGYARWLERLAEPDAGPPAPAAAADPGVRAHCDRATYTASVARCRDHILAGDVFEVCLTHRLEADLPATPWRLYEVLRAGNPAPFAAYIDAGGAQVVSASPERFLRLDRDGRAESRPIKGTRPRGADPATDLRLRDELAASDKDRAENLMIVDLVRSDLGRVCETGSVAVPELLAVESYATVHQLVSTVQGRLRTGLDAIDLVRACFPGGSMTGAPKIAAMGIIDAVEPVVRGVYSGALGYLDRGGAMDLCIVIRTLVCTGGRATCGVGGAVTADSDPDAEYEESLDKARALLEALGRAR